MTLFIACLLIYSLDMSAWWYLVAVLIWMLHLAFYALPVEGREALMGFTPEIVKTLFSLAFVTAVFGALLYAVFGWLFQ